MIRSGVMVLNQELLKHYIQFLCKDGFDEFVSIRNNTVEGYSKLH